MVDDTAQPPIEGLRRHLRIISDFGKLALQPHLDSQELLDAAVHAAVEGTLVERAKIMVYDPTRDDLQILAGVGWAPGVIGMHVSADLRSPAGKALRSIEPVSIEDLPNDPAYDYNEPMRSHAIRSLVNVPIRTEDGPVGVLEIDSQEKIDLGQDAERFLDGLAHFVAIAIARINAERAARSSAAASVTAAAERELLHAELEHRVANDLHGLQATAMLELRRADNEAARQLGERMLQRVDAVIKTHRQLATDADDRQIRIRPFLESLCHSLRTANPIQVSLSAADVSLPMRQAVTLGRLVNEIVTNSIKHAFGEGDAGAISVGFEAGDHATHGCRLLVSDSGRGMGPVRAGGRGLGLISALAAQLEGDVRRDATPGTGGTRYEIAFPCRAVPAATLS